MIHDGSHAADPKPIELQTMPVVEPRQCGPSDDNGVAAQLQLVQDEHRHLAIQMLEWSKGLLLHCHELVAMMRAQYQGPPSAGVTL